MSDRALLEELLDCIFRWEQLDYNTTSIVVKRKAAEIRTRMAEIKHDCETCRFENKNMQFDPCRYCWTKGDGSFPKWQPKEQKDGI